MQKNLAAIFFGRIPEMGEQSALIFKVNKGAYQSMTWPQLGRFATELGCGLAELGVKPEDKVAIFSQSSHLWVIADIATICNGAISVPIYPTSALSDIEYILNNSEAKVVFVQDKRLLQKVLSIRESLPNVKAFVLMEPNANKKVIAEIVSQHNLKKDYLLTLEEVQRRGAKYVLKDRDLLRRRGEAIKPDSIATIIYTSGTTGVPKGVPLTHSNIVSVIEDLTVVLPISHKEVYLSYLPLSHVFERVCGEFYWWSCGGACAFAEGIETMAKNMAEVNPSMILVVPRVLDRIYSKVRSGIDGASGRRRQLIDWALSVGSEMIQVIADGQTPSVDLKAKHWVANKLVLRKLRERIGVNLRLIVSGGAPATSKTLEFFNAVGFACLEGYGLTETAAPACVNAMNRVKLGTVGPTLPSVNVKLSEEGEIMLSGPTVCSSYYKNEEATREAFDDGWFKTGDIGEIDKDGYIKITDRKKDIIVNSAGKNIAPQRIEAIIKTVPLVTQAVVFGDKKKHLIALLTLDEQVALEFANEKNWNCRSFAEVAASEELNQILKQEIQKRSKSLADYEQVRKVAVLPHDLSVDAGELTATLKIKRNVVAKNYADLIASLYDERPVSTESRTLAATKR